MYEQNDIQVLFNLFIDKLNGLSNKEKTTVIKIDHGLLQTKQKLTIIYL